MWGVPNPSTPSPPALGHPEACGHVACGGCFHSLIKALCSAVFLVAAGSLSLSPFPQTCVPHFQGCLEEPGCTQQCWHCLAGGSHAIPWGGDCMSGVRGAHLWAQGLSPGACCGAEHPQSHSEAAPDLTEHPLGCLACLGAPGAHSSPLSLANHDHSCKIQPGPGPENRCLPVRSGEGVHRVRGGRLHLLTQRLAVLPRCHGEGHSPAAQGCPGHCVLHRGDTSVFINDWFEHVLSLCLALSSLGQGLPSSTPLLPKPLSSSLHTGRSCANADLGLCAHCWQ